MPKENIQLPANFLWGSRSITTISEVGADKQKLTKHSFLATDDSKTSLTEHKLKQHPTTTNSKTTLTEQNIIATELKNQKLNTYYLSLDWSALEPQAGKFNHELLYQHAQLWL